jgi:pimeloyl-ACP methyl ester carboxylesterase
MTISGSNQSTLEAASPGEGSASVSAVDPCPTPLSVAEVLQQFREASDEWTLQRDGATLRGRTLGHGRPLIFLNGIGGTHELFALFAWLLREEFRCILYDYPDRDASKRPASREFAGDLLAVAREHGEDHFFIYAASFGSLVALTAMLEAPQSIHRAILQGGFAFRRLSIAERVLLRAGRHVPGTLSRVRLRERIQANNHHIWFPPFDAIRWNFFLENTGGVQIRTIARRAAILRDTDLREHLPRIEQPVMVIRSEGEGMVCTRSVEELAAGLPNCRKEWLHSCGHLPHLTHPHRLAKLVREFLGEGDGARAS